MIRTLVLYQEDEVRKFIVNFVLIFAFASAAGVATTYIWNLIRHGQAVVDWNTVVTLAVVLGLVLSILESRRA